MKMKKLVGLVAAVAVLISSMPVLAGVQPRLTTPDDCEPNDSKLMAYPYDRVPVVKDKMTSEYDLDRLGYRHAGLHSESDVDWYYVNLKAGEECFADLRNIGKTNWYIEVYHYDASGDVDFYETTNPEMKSKFTNKPEKYFYFIPKTTGKYYIRITNGGDWSSEMHYFFYVGPVKQEFDIVDMPIGAVKIWGSNYQTFTCDLRGSAVPKNSRIINLSIKDSFPLGKECREVEKYMRAGGMTYYSPSGGSIDTISGISGVSLGQLWTVGGRCARNNHITQWSAKLNGRFSCEMAPYPGNEVP